MSIVREGGALATGATRGVGKQFGGFKKFILRGNVVDLAVGVVIGAAFSGVVQALVKDVIAPLIGIFGGVPDFSAWTILVRGSRFAIGDFVNALISFLLIALVVYFLVVLPVTKLMDKYKPEPQPSPTKECPECVSKIPVAARRCPQCTAQIEPPSEGVAAAMRSIAAPSGEHIADEAARVLVNRLQGHPDEGQSEDQTRRETRVWPDDQARSPEQGKHGDQVGRSEQARRDNRDATADDLVSRSGGNRR